MRLTIKTLITVSILALCVLFASQTYAQPRDKSEPGFNKASLERAGPTVLTENVFVAVNFDQALLDVRAIGLTVRETPRQIDYTDSLSTAIGASKAYAKRGFLRTSLYLRE